VSEYQYYDFRALDSPLTPRQQSALRTLSSRAEIRFLQRCCVRGHSEEPRSILDGIDDAVRGNW
jgi:hypothetical protein